MNNNTATSCPCDTSEHPPVITNLPGQARIDYRTGDYITFRHALLVPRSGEVELATWQPGAEGDLAVQLVEWWAYLSDILTFYNERIANQSYLRTADLPESVQRLIRILGYRPRPGIGAHGTLAALMSKSTPFTLPQGFPVQSKPGPGQQPQIFELDADTAVASPDVASVEVVPASTFLCGSRTALLKGVLTTVKVNDELLVLDKNDSCTYVLATVDAVQQVKDPQGNSNTQVTFSAPLTLPKCVQAKDYRLLKSAQSAHVWQYHTGQNVVIGSNSGVISTVVPADAPINYVNLEAITRQIKVGDPLLFENPATHVAELVTVTAYQEVVWFANAADPNNPQNPPEAGDTQHMPPIPIPHTVLNYSPATTNDWDSQKSTMLVRYAWQDVGQLLNVPSTSVYGPSITTLPLTPLILPGSNVPVLLEDANGQGAAAMATLIGTPPQLQLTGLPVQTAFTPPLRVYFDLLSVSRGKTVAKEILGNGNPSIAGQEFTLQKSPLTYLVSSASLTGQGYKSTLSILVNDIEWQEVASFYGQSANATIFVTREDESASTHVQFGDGINGARLPAGVNNIVARYRYGSGAAAPGAGQLTVITQPWPNLKAIRNPQAVGGGSDPDASQQIQRYAPQSVLTFGRAISADDYETIAIQTPGVARAKSYWVWNQAEQRTLVTVYVGDDSNAVTAAISALAGADDPNRPVLVKSALSIPVQLMIALRISPNNLPSAVVAAVTAKLLDEESGLFGSRNIGIGQIVYQSQIYELCLEVPGVLAAHRLHFSRNLAQRFTELSGYRYDPGEGGFFQLQPDNLTILQEV